MCGIAGIFHFQAAATVNRALLEDMNQAQFHRGPDEGGIHIEAGVGLAHRRLSIIDLSTGQQPLYNEDNSVVVVFNGEIYNFQDLSKELKDHGHEFRTHSDTEAIVHAWEQWGPDCVKRLRGMFAFAIWDKNQGTLFIARDRLGIKPLFYASLANDEFVFASELKSLMVHPKLQREIDPLAVEDYFAYGYVPEPKTIFKQARKLHPGHTLLLKRGQSEPKIQQYWDVPFSPIQYTSQQEMHDELLHRLQEAVQIRMLAEVPLGAFLSGGVDSSAVVGLMAKVSAEPVNTCSISFGDPKFNETPHALAVAKQFKTNHRVEQVDPNDFDILDQLATLYDEPYADSSAMPTYRVCELAKKSVTVALSGDGGDENFAGYRRYKWHMYEESVRSRLPLSLRRPLFGMLGKYYPKLDWAPRIFRAKTTFQAMARDSVAAYAHTVAIMPQPWRQKLFSPGFRKQLQNYSADNVLYEYAKQSPTDHPLSLIQYLDMKTYLVGDILTKVDRASMAHALEVRVPLLDHKFVEWASGLSPDLKLKGGDGKYVLKSALESLLTKETLYRPKMGFAVPLATWFRGPLREHVHKSILGENMQETGFFNQGFLKHIVEQHSSGMRDYSAAIWSLLMFESFYRQQVLKG